jgi:hypothetical protein
MNSLVRVREFVSETASLDFFPTGHFLRRMKGIEIVQGVVRLVRADDKNPTRIPSSTLPLNEARDGKFIGCMRALTNSRQYAAMDVDGDQNA